MAARTRPVYSHSAFDRQQWCLNKSHNVTMIIKMFQLWIFSSLRFCTSWKHSPFNGQITHYKCGSFCCCLCMLDVLQEALPKERKKERFYEGESSSLMTSIPSIRFFAANRLSCENDTDYNFSPNVGAEMHFGKKISIGHARNIAGRENSISFTVCYNISSRSFIRTPFFSFFSPEPACCWPSPGTKARQGEAYVNRSACRICMRSHVEREVRRELCSIQCTRYLTRHTVSMSMPLLYCCVAPHATNCNQFVRIQCVCMLSTAAPYYFCHRQFTVANDSNEWCVTFVDFISVVVCRSQHTHTYTRAPLLLTPCSRHSMQFTHQHASGITEWHGKWRLLGM